MNAVVAVRRLGIGSVQVVRRVGHVTVRGSLVGLTSASPTQRLVRMVEPAPYRRETLVPGVVERAVGLCSPEPVLLGDQLLDLIQHGLLVHGTSITRRASSPPATNRARAERSLELSRDEFRRKRRSKGHRVVFRRCPTPDLQPDAHAAGPRR